MLWTTSIVHLRTGTLIFSWVSHAAINRFLWLSILLREIRRRSELTIITWFGVRAFPLSLASIFYSLLFTICFYSTGICTIMNVFNVLFHLLIPFCWRAATECQKIHQFRYTYFRFVVVVVEKSLPTILINLLLLIK